MSTSDLAVVKVVNAAKYGVFRGGGLPPCSPGPLSQLLTECLDKPVLRRHQAGLGLTLATASTITRRHVLGQRGI